MTESEPVLVCGGTGLIGSAVARHLATLGHTVAVHGNVNDEQARAIATACGGRSRAFIADLSSPGEADRLLEEVERTLGTPHAVVNAAAHHAGDALVADLEDDVIAAHLQNLHLQVVVARAAARVLRHPGRLVLLSGALSSRVFPGMSMYAATCAALNALSRTLALEVGPAGVTVNTIAPGRVESGEPHADYDALTTMSRQRAALNSFATPEDIASLVGYLISPAARSVTGQIVYLAAGEPV